MAINGQSRRSARFRPRAIGKRPSLPAVDPEMRRWASVLAQELATWPDVSSRLMFGLQAFYRGPAIFAALPKTRAAEAPSGLLLKLSGVRNRRLRRGIGPGAGWMTFTMHSESDIAEALRWLGLAYERAE